MQNFITSDYVCIYTEFKLIPPELAWQMISIGRQITVISQFWQLSHILAYLKKEWIVLDHKHLSMCFIECLNSSCRLQSHALMNYCTNSRQLSQYQTHWMSAYNRLIQLVRASKHNLLFLLFYSGEYFIYSQNSYDSAVWEIPVMMTYVYVHQLSREPVRMNVIRCWYILLGGRKLPFPCLYSVVLAVVTSQCSHVNHGKTSSTTLMQHSFIAIVQRVKYINILVYFTRWKIHQY